MAAPGARRAIRRRGGVGRLLVTLLALGCGSGVFAVQEDASSRPARDAILITVDTLRWDALGFSGNEAVATPALDALAANGVVFERAHAHNVFTLPSHANILTGLLPYQHGVRDNAGFVLDAEVPTVATVLRAAGFATGAVVGAFPLDARYGLARGFGTYDDHYPEGAGEAFVLPERRGDEVVAAGLAWWRAHAGERRFLWLHLFDPHAPYQPEEPWRSRYATAPYLGEVAAVDAYLKPLLDELSASWDRTVLVFTADHGEALGDHGEQTHGLFAYEATLRVPLVVRAPEVGPRRTRAPARHIDIAPTLFAALGVESPPGLAGRSLLDREPGEPPIEYFESLNATLTRDWAPLRGLIRGAHKLIDLPIVELYDLDRDPAESQNLAASQPRLLADLRRLLPVESTWPPRASAVSDQDAAALERLGYVTGGGGGESRRYTAEDDPKTLVGLHQKVHRLIDLFQRGELEAATRLAREVVAERPGMGLGYYQLAEVLLARSQVAEALAVMNEARERGVASPRLLRQLGLTLAEVGRPAEGVRVLAPLAEDGEPDALAALGLVLSEAGRQAEAREVLERVFERDPRHPVARMNLALVAVRQGRWREAEQQARLALELNGGLALAWNYLGVALYNQGRAGPALEAWQRALEIEPGNFDVLYNFAIVALEAGDRARARAALERFVAEAPPDRYRDDIARARQRLEALGQ